MKIIDLNYHANLYLNYFERNPDSKLDYLPYFESSLLSIPSYYKHSRWGELVENLARHCVSRYGLPEVKNWSWEV